MWTHSASAPSRRWLVLAALSIVAGSSQPDGAVPREVASNQWRAFEGSWTAAGTRRTLQLGSDRRAAIFDLTGSLLLSGPERPAVGFRAHAIGFSDTREGMEGRCVWTDERGDKVFSALKGEFVGSGNRTIGTFVGGTGRYTGVTGEYSFQWQYVIESEDGAVSGRAIALKGRARLDSSAATPSRAPGQ
jgi:hypothetical protein